jgi:hypothetical protein
MKKLIIISRIECTGKADNEYITKFKLAAEYSKVSDGVLIMDGQVFYRQKANGPNADKEQIFKGISEKLKSINFVNKNDEVFIAYHPGHGASTTLNFDNDFKSLAEKVSVKQYSSVDQRVIQEILNLLSSPQQQFDSFLDSFFLKAKLKARLQLLHSLLQPPVSTKGISDLWANFQSKMGVDVGEKEKEAWGKFNTFSASELKKYNKNPLDKKYTDSLTILRETFIA